MEFFKILEVRSDETEIRQQLLMDKLERFSSQLFDLGYPGDQERKVGTLWGEFTLVRTLIRGGVRMALKECPNALAWTVTAGSPPDENVTVIHLTINRKEIPEEFIKEIDEFMEDHGNCLLGLLKSKKDKLKNKSLA